MFTKMFKQFCSMEENLESPPTYCHMKDLLWEFNILVAQEVLPKVI